VLLILVWKLANKNENQGEILFSRAVGPTDRGTEPRHWRRQLAKLSSARRAQIWCPELRGPGGGEGKGGERGQTQTNLNAGSTDRPAAQWQWQRQAGSEHWIHP
jgi:hypothetical protein